jgi:hypothetical protein
MVRGTRDFSDDGNGNIFARDAQSSDVSRASTAVQTKSCARPRSPAICAQDFDRLVD